MKTRNLFFILNILLVVVIGVAIGLTCKDYIFANGAGTSAFICLLVTLALPSLIYLYSSKLKIPGVIATILFLVAEFVVNILFLCKPSFGDSAFWISQAGVIGAFLVADLIILASNKKPEEEK